MTLTTTRPNPYTMRELNQAARTHAEKQAARRSYIDTYREREKHQWITAIVMDELDLTPKRYLSNNGVCFQCGAHCPKKTTPVFSYSVNKREYWFCKTCLDMLKQGAAEFQSALQVYRGNENDQEAPIVLQKYLSGFVTGKLDSDIQERLDRLQISAAGSVVQVTPPNGSLSKIA